MQIIRKGVKLLTLAGQWPKGGRRKAMRDTRRRSHGIKMPRVEFDLKAINEIKERKRGFYGRAPKESKEKAR